MAPVLRYVCFALWNYCIVEFQSYWVSFIFLVVFSEIFDGFWNLNTRSQWEQVCVTSLGLDEKSWSLSVFFFLNNWWEIIYIYRYILTSQKRLRQLEGVKTTTWMFVSLLSEKLVSFLFPCILISISRKKEKKIRPRRFSHYFCGLSIL